MFNNNEIKMIALGIVIGLMYYSVNYVCSMLYDHGCDIFGKFNKKKKKKSRSRRNKGLMLGVIPENQYE